MSAAAAAGLFDWIPAPAYGLRGQACAGMTTWGFAGRPPRRRIMSAAGAAGLFDWVPAPAYGLRGQACAGMTTWGFAGDDKTFAGMTTGGFAGMTTGGCAGHIPHRHTPAVLTGPTKLTDSPNRHSRESVTVRMIV